MCVLIVKIGSSSFSRCRTRGPERKKHREKRTRVPTNNAGCRAAATAVAAAAVERESKVYTTSEGISRRKPSTRDKELSQGAGQDRGGDVLRLQ